MRNLRIPTPTIKQPPLRKYGTFSNLTRLTEYNKVKMEEWVLDNPYNLTNQHILVQLLKMLSIDPEWTLEEVIAIVRFKTDMVCSNCSITNKNRVSLPQTGVFYNDCSEQLFLVYKDREYSEETLTLDSLTGIIPTYIDKSFISYLPSIERTENTSHKKNNVAFIGIDVLELAIGWWLYMKEWNLRDSGISSYLVNYPLRKASLIHNQLNIINSLHDLICHDIHVNQSVKSEKVKFITVDESSQLRKYVQFLDTVFSGRRLVGGVNQLLSQIGSLYKDVETPYSYLSECEDLDNWNNTRWVLEAMTLKLFKVYLTYANNLFYNASDINTDIRVLGDKLLNNYKRIPDKDIKFHLTQLLNDVISLNEENMT